MIRVETLSGMIQGGQATELLVLRLTIVWLESKRGEAEWITDKRDSEYPTFL
jgi:hypothetical protein